VVSATLVKAMVVDASFFCLRGESAGTVDPDAIARGLMGCR
jgi:hypothetical protein